MPIDTAFSAQQEVPRGTEILGVGVFNTARGLKAAGKGHPRLDLSYLASRGFTAKPGESIALPAGAGKAVLAIGLGESGKLDAEGLRHAGAALARNAKSPRAAMAMGGVAPSSMDASSAAQAFVEGVALAAYEFDAYRSRDIARGKSGATRTARTNGMPKKRSEQRLIDVVLTGSGVSALRSGAHRGRTIAGAVALARDLVNEPAGSLPPQRLAEIAVESTASNGVDVTVWDEERIASEKLGGVMGVSMGSAQPPRMAIFSYRPEGKRTTGAKKAICLVGKGVCFDSGGLSLKSAGGMETMKTDMGGAAAVIATMSVVRALDIGCEVMGFTPMVENMPGGKAMRPGDVLTARNGKTIEVLNTDAEGRLILADALSLATESKPAAIVDLATLTGACIVALGDRIAGLMGNNEELIRQLENASKRSGEGLWHLPLPSEYRSHIDSDIADMKNIGAAGQAGTLSAGIFLSEFVGSTPWAHLDIAGPARSSGDDGYRRKGGTGFGVRTLLELLGSFTAPRL